MFRVWTFYSLIMNISQGYSLVKWAYWKNGLFSSFSKKNPVETFQVLQGDKKRPWWFGWLGLDSNSYNHILYVVLWEWDAFLCHNLFFMGWKSKATSWPGPILSVHKVERDTQWPIFPSLVSRFCLSPSPPPFFSTDNLSNPIYISFAYISWINTNHENLQPTHDNWLTMTILKILTNPKRDTEGPRTPNNPTCPPIIIIDFIFLLCNYIYPGHTQYPEYVWPSGAMYGTLKRTVVSTSWTRNSILGGVAICRVLKSLYITWSHPHSIHKLKNMYTVFLCTPHFRSVRLIFCM